MSSKTTKIEVDLIQGIVEKRNKMLAASKEEADHIIRVANEECAKIKAEAERQVKAIIDSRLKGVRERIVGEAEMQARHKMLATRDSIISSIFDETVTELSELSDSEEREEEYMGILIKLIGEAMTSIGGEHFIISANPRDTVRIRNNLKKIEKELKLQQSIRLEVSKDPLEAIGGVVLENGNRTRMYYNTFESRMNKVRRGIITSVAEVLEVA
jgi:vacuolar-type H+-ATPase subunit E/Vma4